jgi:hypothetical protein
MFFMTRFSFEYIGGGYFRKIGVPKGEKAEILHGQEATDRAVAEATGALRNALELICDHGTDVEEGKGIALDALRATYPEAS